MVIFLVTITILGLFFLIFDPTLHTAPIRGSGRWLIVEYNKYTVDKCRIKKEREWAPLFSINK